MMFLAGTQLLADPSETTNIVNEHLDLVAKLAPILATFNDHYVTGHLDAQALAKYKPVDKSAWGTFMGPCYRRA